MKGLRRVLTEEQIEQILDKYTVGKVAFTLKGYQAIVPNMTEEETAFVLEQLKLAREQAIDYKNMKQISAVFEIYKTKCEQYFNGKPAVRCQPFRSKFSKFTVRQAARGMPCRIAPLLRSHQRTVKIRRIREYKVILPFILSGKILQTAMEGMQTLPPRRTREVIPGFQNGSLIYVYGINPYAFCQKFFSGMQVRTPLGSHQSNGTRTRPYIKQETVVRRNAHDSPEKDTVSVHLHGAAPVLYGKFLETENPHGIHSRTNCPSIMKSERSHMDASSLSWVTMIIVCP